MRDTAGSIWLPRQMDQRYPDDVKAWVNAHHAMDGFRMTMMRQPEVASYVPTCAASTRK